jgi:hypothetical protein
VQPETVSPPATTSDGPEQVPIIAPPHERRESYLATKRDKLGHLFTH